MDTNDIQDGGSNFEPLLNPSNQQADNDLEIEVENNDYKIEDKGKDYQDGFDPNSIASDETSLQFEGNNQYRTASESSAASQINMERRTFEANTVFHKKNQARQFPNNEIRTAKYNWLTFLPKNLFEQFTKMANFYFLILSLMEMIKPISDSNGQPVLLLPLGFVVTVSMIKDFFEDRKRKKQDNDENRRLTLSCKRGDSEFLQTKGKEVQVGCIVKVTENQFFPCDLIMLNSNLTKGICYVETKSLDGETNLKQKMAQKPCIPLATDDDSVLQNFNGSTIECDPPNEFLYKFNGNMTLPDGTVLPIDPDQVLLRGSKLRNTQWLYGIAVYTGHQTKIMKNSTGARSKKSKLDIKTNTSILWLILFQIVICLVAGLYSAIWQHNSGFYYYPYLDFKTQINMLSESATGFGIWFLAMMNLVPISLMVTLEMVKFLQAQFIQWDADMYDETIDMPTNVQASNLNEELGMVHYIFSDKTGTLTQNVMDFKKFTVGTQSYGCTNPEKQEYAPGVTNVHFQDPKFFEQIEDPGHFNYQNIRKFVECLGLCHTIIIEEKEIDGEKAKIYNASSPDELALVNGARHFGFTFEERDDENNMVFNCYGETKKYKLMNVLEFTSARKRMTVIVRSEEGRYLVICKGADSIIAQRLKADQPFLEKTQQYLEDFANEGLRTLLVASKEISEADYMLWADKYGKAQIHINKDKEVDKCCEELEVEFDLAGSTAIEDKLQTDCGKTIYDIKKAGIKLWVLTGDKIETAINIGFSCHLLNKQMEMFMINEIKSKKIMQQITESQAIQKRQLKSRGNAVILSADSLTQITKHPALKDEFLALAKKANVVLACRVSPKQKAEIVRMMRAAEPGKSTLAIGDGANDVNMITAAHIGVGISGLEGQQAARAADYSIGQFRFLKNLLFCHGREAYRRNSYLISYMFWKNIVYVVPIWVFGFVSFFSGTVIYNPYLYNFYNVSFTGLPIIWFSVFDFEHDRKTLLSKPKLYRIGIKNEHFSSYVFFRWFGYGFWQGALLLCLAFYELDSAPTHDGKVGGLLVDGGYVFTVVVVLVNFKVLVSSFLFEGWQFFFIFGSIIVYYLCFWGVSAIKISGAYGEFQFMSLLPSQYIGLFFFTSAYLLIDIGMQQANKEIARWRTIKDYEDKIIRLDAEFKDVTVERSRMTQYEHRGYAFSGASGQDQIVTESLTQRMQKALKTQLMANMGVVKASTISDKETPDDQQSNASNSLLNSNNLKDSATNKNAS